MAKRKKRRKYKPPVIAQCPLKGRESEINYKNVSLLEKFISTRGRIMPTVRTGVCPANQRALTQAIKRARFMALLPYTKYV